VNIGLWRQCRRLIRINPWFSTFIVIIRNPLCTSPVTILCNNIFFLEFWRQSEYSIALSIFVVFDNSCEMDMARITFLQVAESARPSGIHVAEQDKDRMTALEARVRSLEVIGESSQANSDAQRQTRSRSRLQPRPRNRDSASSGLCWYHWRFVSEARNAVKRYAPLNN